MRILNGQQGFFFIHIMISSYLPYGVARFCLTFSFPPTLIINAENVKTFMTIGRTADNT